MLQLKRNVFLCALSPRQHEIARLVAEGLSNKEIANSLGISEQTVKNQLRQICLRFEVQKRTQVAVLWLKLSA